MGKITLAAAAAAAVLLLAGMGSSAYAINFSVDVPVSGDAKFKDPNGSTSVSYSGLSGYRVGAGIGWFGLGYEAYEGKTDLSKISGPSDLKLKSTFTDLQIDFPIPVINIALGYGVGQIKDECGGGACKDKWDATQYYLTLGLPIFKVADVHVSYHAISANAKEDSTGNKPPDIDSTVYFVGARVGW